MDSILASIEKMLGIQTDFNGFDTDIIIGINTAFTSLNQLGIGPEEGFIITGFDEKWSDFLGAATDLEAVKTYVFLKTRLVFDPPTNGFLVTAMENQIKELEWRLNVQIEYIPPEV